MMNNAAFDSECTSGCESGWTLYLEEQHSFLNQKASSSHRFTTGFYEEHKQDGEEEEDLSMVSDASSGPPHFPDEEQEQQHHNGCFYSPPKVVKLAKSGQKKQRVKKNQHSEDQFLPSFLHDTATSHHSDFSSTNNVTGTNQQNSTQSMMDYSQGSTATYFGGSSSFQEQQHFSFLQPSLSQNGLQGNKWKGIGMR